MNMIDPENVKTAEDVKKLFSEPDIISVKYSFYISGHCDYGGYVCWVRPIYRKNLTLTNDSHEIYFSSWTKRKTFVEKLKELSPWPVEYKPLLIGVGHFYPTTGGDNIVRLIRARIAKAKSDWADILASEGENIK